MKISREKLYRLVWETPLTKLAKEFGVSDVGLARACRKTAIPTPPVGHWTKVAHGKGVERPPLPKSDEHSVEVDAARVRAPSPVGLSAAASLVQPSVKVHKALGDLAPTAAATHAALGKVKSDPHGFVRTGSATCFTCILSAASVERAVLLLDGIERTLPDVGAKLVRDRDGKRVALAAEGEQMTFEITENYGRGERVVVDPVYSWSKRREYTYAFKGTLKLALDGAFNGRKTWSDGVRGRLEDKLGSFVVGVVEAARAIRALRKEREEQRRRWEKEAQLLRMAADRARRDKAFRDSFEKEAAAWHKHQQASAYLEHLKSKLAMHSAELPSAGVDWLSYAELAVAQLNPSPERVRRLIEGYEPPGWLAPFGDPIV